MNEVNARGFTLIELAIVLVIVGILLGSFIGSLTARIENAKIEETEKELAEIKQALLAYAFTQFPPRLPCPDSDSPPDGISNICAGNSFGTLPYFDLGLGQADAWDTRYRYWVDGAYSVGFDLSAPQGSAQINNASIAIVPNAVAVIFSHGKNGLGGTSVDGVNRDAIPGVGHDYEVKNMDATDVFESGPRTDIDTAAGEFDDILIWISEYELKAKMVEAGALP